MITCFWSEVVVNHVQDHAEPQLVSLIDEPAHVVGAAVNVIGRIEIHSVVAPTEIAGKLGDGHDLDRGDAKLDQPRKAIGRGSPFSFLCECSQVQLVKHLALQPQPFPVLVMPGKAARVDHLRGTMRTLGLKSGSRVGIAIAAARPVAIQGAVARTGGGSRKVTVTFVFKLQRVQIINPVFSLEQDFKLVTARCPDPEMHPAAGQDFSTNGQPPRRGHGLASSVLMVLDPGC